MSKIFQGLILAAIVVLAAAVIGLYFRGGVATIIKEIKIGASSIISPGGPPTGVNELRFADEVDVGFRKLTIVNSTSTLDFSNFEKDRVITRLDFQYTGFGDGSSATTSPSSFWVLMATSTATTSRNVVLPGKDAGAAIVFNPLNAAKFIWAAKVATNTFATSTPFRRYTSAGLEVRDDALPLVLNKDEKMFFRVYHTSEMPAWNGTLAGTGFVCTPYTAGTCPYSSTSTFATFNNQREIIIQYHD